jgi:urease accessory protein UreH
MIAGGEFCDLYSLFKTRLTVWEITCLGYKEIGKNASFFSFSFNILTHTHSSKVPLLARVFQLGLGENLVLWRTLSAGVVAYGL